MRKIKLKQLLLIATGMLWAGLASSQISVNASGSDAVSSEGSAAYSIGQIVYTTHTGSTGFADQGVQHAYEVFIVGTRETKPDISLLVYPNPTAESLTLHIGNYNSEKLFYHLYDLHGKLLLNGQIDAPHTPINLSGFSSASYFLMISDQNRKAVQTFKILKNQ